MTAEVSGPKLIILHDAAKNTYRVLAHNFTDDEAKRFIDEWNPHVIAGKSIIAITQRKRHKTAYPETCRACRSAVRDSSGLEPSPKFTRRKE